jgi:hypothetical protein
LTWVDAAAAASRFARAAKGKAETEARKQNSFYIHLLGRPRYYWRRRRLLFALA